MSVVQSGCGSVVRGVILRRQKSACAFCIPLQTGIPEHEQGYGQVQPCFCFVEPDAQHFLDPADTVDDIIPVHVKRRGVSVARAR
jgi:hypothetical protein